MLKNKYFIVAAVLLMVFAAAWFAWSKWASPTKIALVNFQPFQTTSMIKANEDDFVKYETLSVEEFSKLNRYDMVIGFAMGMKITAEQREQLQQAADKGLPVFMYAATNPANKINSLDSLQNKAISGYMNNGNRVNYRNMARYIRQHIDKKTLFVTPADSVVESASDVLYHLDDTRSFETVQAYESYLKDKGFYKEGAKKLAIVGGMNDPFSGNRENIDSIIVSFEKAGLNVYPVSSVMKRLDFLKEIEPDAVIYFPHGRMSMGNADAAVDWLKEKNIPLFAPLTILQSEADWNEDKMGMMGGFLSQSVVMPELDGAIYPYVVNAQTVDKDGLYLFKAIPDRLHHFTKIVTGFLDLKTKPNSEKKIAIYFFKGAGQESLTAQGLQSVPSLYNLLKRMKSEGYVINHLPATEKEFEHMLMSQGAVLSTYAEGAFDDFLKNGKPALIEKSEYEHWVEQAMPASLYADVVNTYGEAPGQYMHVQQDGKDYLAVARIDLGNVVLLPQPMAALGSDAFAIVHGAKSAPPHTYIGAYLWSQYAFKADAMLHFGTHGSLEFTPQKQVALGSYDWPDRLVGAVPHFYYYTIGNIGESMMAKRRSYATTISYLTPAFMETDTRSLYIKLQDKIQAYYKTDEDKQPGASLEVKKVAVQMGLHRDLKLDSVLTHPYTEEEIGRIENFAEEISNEKMNGRFYVTGVPYEEPQIRSSVLAMAADPIAYSLAALDRLKGKVTDKELNRKVLFTARYLDPAKQLVNQVLNGKEVNDALICAVAGITTKDLEEAKTILAPKKRSMMGGGSSSSMSATSNEKSGETGRQGGHPAWIPKFGKKPDNMQAQHPMEQTPSEKSAEMSETRPEKPEGMGDAKPGRPESMGEDKPERPAEMGEGKPERPSEMGEGRPGKPAGMSDGKPEKPVGKGDAKPGKPEGMGASKAPEYSKEQKDKARAIAEVERTIKNIVNYSTALRQSPELEMKGILNALSGGYIAPSSGGDAVANPNAVPTGRNLYAVNAEATPSEVAWDKGVDLANATIAHYKKEHNAYPRKVSYTFWSSEFIETEGATIAQVLYMLGVEPVRDAYGRVSDLQLIPSETLGRPRIDVVVQTSGQFRDLAASRLALITRAVEMAASAKDDQFDNYVANSTVETERLLVEQGISPKEARDLSTKRVFGGINGMYGTGIQEMVTSGDKWEDEQEIAETYIHNVGAIYGNEKEWGQYQSGLLKAVLHNTDAVVQPRQSNTWGALSLDHVYEFMGGMNLAVRHVTGKDPEAYFADYRNRNRVKMQEIKEAIGVEARATIFNPTFVKEIMKGGSSEASRITEVVTNTYGWNVMKPKAIDNEMWDQIYDVYVKDGMGLGVEKFFRETNPAALQEITAVMMETARKGMWKATDQQLKDVAELHTNLVNEFGSKGSGFSGGNVKLQEFIAQKADPQQAAEYKTKLNEMKSASPASSETVKDGMVLKKETVGQEAPEKNTLNGVLIGAVVLVAFMILLFILKKKRSKA